MRRKNISILIFISFIYAYANAQLNNVLNYSFEQNSGCLGYVNCHTTKVTYWTNPTSATPDWLNPCGAPNFGTPQNYAGYQDARSGSSYAGIDFSEPAHYREYITGTFLDSLIATKKYCIAFYVSLGDSLWWAVSSLGAYISNDSVCEKSSITVLPYLPQIENPAANILTNKVDWLPISGEYLANGGEKFITIGDFYSDTLSHFTYVGNGGTLAGWQSEVNAYYYIDDVSVRELTIAVAGKNDTICAGDSIMIGKDPATVGVSFHWLPRTGLSNPNIAQPKASPTVQTTYTLTVINDSIHNCNCADSVTKDSITISVCTGINELKENRGIEVFPNPSAGLFSLIGLSPNLRIELYDNMGRLVNSTISKASSMQFNLSNNADGIYLIRISTKDSKFVGQRKVVKTTEF